MHGVTIRISSTDVCDSINYMFILALRDAFIQVNVWCSISIGISLEYYDNKGYSLLISINNWPLEVARSDAWVCGNSFAGIVGSNPTGGIDVCLLWVFCVVR